MNNKEFIELSKKEVKSLNGSETEAAQEAWRAGYNYARMQVRKMMNTYFMDECLTKLEEMCEGELIYLPKYELRTFSFLRVGQLILKKLSKY